MNGWLFAAGILLLVAGIIDVPWTTLWVGPADETPARPNLDRLREAGIPVVEDEEFEDALESTEQRRHLLEGLIEKARSERPPLGEPS